jgi:flagellin-like protein
MKMKGISAVVATVLMLLITITLAGVAYTFTIGAFTRSTQGIEIDDYFCSGGTVSLVIRNIGSENVTTLTCTQTAPAGDTCSLSPTVSASNAIQPGQSMTLQDTCSGSGGRTCVYRLVPPTGKSVTANAYCTG